MAREARSPLVLGHLSNARRAFFRAPRQGGGDRLLAREESEEVRLRGTGPLGNDLGGNVVAALGPARDRSALMVLSRLSRLLIRRMPPCRPGVGQLDLKPAGDAARDQFRA
ncbi:hypothetical protein ACFXGR_31335 [Streptomyces mirabilis]|uniref:hypothetical protein n=1 Tax=Streptomyces mirabilis TaxID=68239 RepID=UPI0036BB454A